jgi:hypothetical protein
VKTNLKSLMKDNRNRVAVVANQVVAAVRSRVAVVANQVAAVDRSPVVAADSRVAVAVRSRVVAAVRSRVVAADAHNRRLLSHRWSPHPIPLPASGERVARSAG